ncbi:MAG: class I adenylate-forming enzyme family protein [Candidatus Neomarinimicrobiota bacterium]
MLEHIAFYSDTKPDFPFIVFGKNRLNYYQAYGKISALAEYLSKSGVVEGQNIGVLLPSIPEFILTYFGILAACGTPVLLNPALPYSDLASVASKLHLDIIIYFDEYQKIVTEMEYRRNLPSKKIVFSKVPSENPQSLANIFRSEVYPPAGTRIGTDRAETIFLTSGTSRFIRPVIFSQENLNRNAHNSISMIRDKENFRMLSTFPLSSPFSHFMMIGPVVLSGNTMVLTNGLNPETVRTTLLEENVDYLITFPEYLRKLLLVSSTSEKPMTLSKCFSTGDYLSVSLLQKFEEKYQSPVLDVYGSTEAGIISMNANRYERKIGSVGKPMNREAIRIVNDFSADVSKEAEGELWIDHSLIFHGYYEDRPRINHTSEKWFPTGDIVRLDSDGYLNFIARKSDRILRYGYWTHPREMELVVGQHPKVLEAFVVPVEKTEKHYTMKLLVVLRPNETMTAEEISSYCQTQLPKYLQPESIEFIEPVEKDSTGKVHRNMIERN